MTAVRVVHEERYWYPDDGGVVWVAGFHLVDEAGRFLGRDAAAERGLLVMSVAGAAAHHERVLQTPGAAPGAPLELRREPDNPHDPDAVAVHTADGDRLGFVPRDLAGSLAQQLDAGIPHAAVTLRERRASPRDPRTGVTMLVVQAQSVDLRNAQEFGH